MNDNEIIAYDTTIAWELASEVGLADTVEHYDAASSRAHSRGGVAVTMLDQVWDRVKGRDDSNADKLLLRSWIQQGLHKRFGDALSKQATKQWGKAAERRLLIAQNAGVATQHVQQHGGAPGDRFPNDMNVAAARLANIQFGLENGDGDESILDVLTRTDLYGSGCVAGECEYCHVRLQIITVCTPAKGFLLR